MAMYYGEDAIGYTRAAPHRKHRDYAHPHARPYVSGAIPYPEQYPPAFYPPHPNVSTTSLRPDRRSVEIIRTSRTRPRSLPPPTKQRDRSPHPHHHDPLRKAQRLFKETFSDSTQGLGVGVLGAIVGGLVAREATDSKKAGRRRTRRSSHHGNNERGKLVSTLVGAAMGGFGANALEKRLENAKERNAEKEETWKRKWSRDSRGRRTDREEEEEEEVVVDCQDDRRRRVSHRRSSEVYVR